MSKYIAVIPRAAITRAALVEAGGRSMDQVKAACGCQYIINAWFYDTDTGRPVGNIKINGAVKASAGWNGWGLAWDKGEDISLEIVPAAGRGNYISGVELLTPTRGPGKALSYSPEYGDTRGRSAVLLAGARVILYCSGDGTRDAKTPEALRDELVSIGCRYDQAALIVLCIPQGGQGLDVTLALSDPGVKFVVFRGQIYAVAQGCPVRPEGRGQIFRADVHRPAVADVVMYHAAAYTHIYIVGVGDRVAGGGEFVPVDVFHNRLPFFYPAIPLLITVLGQAARPAPGTPPG